MARKLRNIEGFVQKPGKRTRVTLDGGMVEEEIDNVVVQPSIKSQSGIIRKPRKRHQTQRALTSDAESDIEISEEIELSLAELEADDNLGADNLDVPEVKESKNKSDKPKKFIKKRSSNKKKSGKKPLKRWQKWLIALLLAVFLIGGTLAFLRYLWPENALDGNIWDVFQHERLQEDINGRTNILIFGTEPQDYDGANLTDSIMVVSLDQDDGSLYTISLPRDLYVEHSDCPNYGSEAGKLNEVYACVIAEDFSNDTEATQALQDKIGEILGLDIPYFVHLNWEGFQAIIDSIGGVDVTIESSDSRGIYDYNTGLQLENGTAHLDGLTALKLARARNSEGGYGLENSNFDREVHQQKIVQAVAEKVVSGGAMNDVGQALNLFNSLGDNLRTNFKANTVNSLVDVAKKIDLNSIIRLPLLDEEKGVRLVKTSEIGGASVVVPTAGTFDYDKIQLYIAKNLTSNPVVREAAVIDVMNGTDEPGLAQSEAEKLEEKNYTIGDIDNAPKQDYRTTEIYQVNSSKANTAKALAKLYNTEVKNGLPSGLDSSEADFIVVVGRP